MHGRGFNYDLNPSSLRQFVRVRRQDVFVHPQLVNTRHPGSRLGSTGQSRVDLSLGSVKVGLRKITVSSKRLGIDLSS